MDDAALESLRLRVVAAGAGSPTYTDEDVLLVPAFAPSVTQSVLTRWRRGQPQSSHQPCPVKRHRCRQCSVGVARGHGFARTGVLLGVCSGWCRLVQASTLAASVGRGPSAGPAL